VQVLMVLLLLGVLIIGVVLMWCYDCVNYFRTGVKRNPRVLKF
jgi:hypothetical protein